MPNVTATTAGYLNVTDASATNATTTGNSAVAHIDPQIFLTTSTDNDIVFRGDRGDYILGHLAPLPSVDVNCDDIILKRLWEEKVKPYLDALILSRVTEEELRNVLKLGGDP